MSELINLKVINIQRIKLFTNNYLQTLIQIYTTNTKLIQS